MGEKWDSYKGTERIVDNYRKMLIKVRKRDWRGRERGRDEQKLNKRLY